MPIWSHKDCVAPHRCSWQVCDVVCIIGPGIVIAARDDLESMSVEMERMLAWIVIVDNDLDDFVGCEDEGIGVRSVDHGVCGVLASRENSIKCRNLGMDISNVVEKRVVCAVVQIVHLHVESDRMINTIKDTFLVVWYETEVIEGLKSLNFLGCILWLSIVVDKPASHVGIETCRYGVEEILVDF